MAKSEILPVGRTRANRRGYISRPFSGPETRTTYLHEILKASLSFVVIDKAQRGCQIDPLSTHSELQILIEFAAMTREPRIARAQS